MSELQAPAPCHLPPCPLDWYQLGRALDTPRWLALPTVERFAFGYEVRGRMTRPGTPDYLAATEALRAALARNAVNHYDLQRTFAQRRDDAHEFHRPFWVLALERLDAGTLLDDEPPPDPTPRK